MIGESIMSIVTSNNKFCDLHVHSNNSDGTNTPKELIEIAEQIGLSAIALCDHNTVKGLRDFLLAAVSSSVEAVPGIEITADFNGKEVHILGLFVNLTRLDEIENYVSQISKYKEESNLNLINALKSVGINLDYDEMVSNANGAYVNRVHFAKAMINSGYVESISEAFERYLDEDKGYYVPAKRLSAFEVIEFLIGVNAMPVLAHPLLNLSQEELEQFLPQAKVIGLTAMETNYSLYDKSKTNTAIALANKYDLLLSGGSDDHGKNKPNISMGVGKGDLFVPAEYYERMKKISL